MRRAWWAISILCPIAFAFDLLDWSRVLVFVLAGLGTIPSAAMLGKATEELALSISRHEMSRRPGGVQPTTRGAKVGGLLNASLGNLPELIFGLLALHQGYISLTKATIAGSVIGNAAFVLGLGLFFGGIRNGTQRFDAVEAGHHAVLMTLTVAALILPSLFVATTHDHRAVEISTVAAALLLAVYLAYLLFSICGLRGGIAGRSRETPETFIEEEAEAIEELAAGERVWSTSAILLLLVLSAGLVFLGSKALVDTVKPFTQSIGWSPFFVGMVVVPVLSNMAEQSSAVLLAYRNRVNSALAVATGSSIQIALLVAPAFVLLSQLGHPLTLVFNPLEIAVLALVVAIFFFISQDGQSNWLEGLQLVVLYAMAATVFFFVPGQLR